MRSTASFAPPCSGPYSAARGAGHRRVRVDVRAADAPHGARAAVLLVIGVQDEQHVERALEDRVDLVFQLRHPEQHVQEVAGEAEVVVGIDVGPSDAVAVGVGGDRRDLRDEPVDLLFARALVEDLLGIRIERRERADGAQEDAHRMRVVLEAFHQLLDVLVQHRVEGDFLRPVRQLRLGRQFAEDDEIGGLEERGPLGELLDRITTVFQDALVAVDVGDLAATGRRVHERRVVGGQALVVARRLDLLQISGLDESVGDGDLVALPRAVVGDGQGIGHGSRRVG
jgi:hypothetical protein